MTLYVSEVEANDLPTLTNLWFAAFSTSNPVERLIYPLGLTPSVTASSLTLDKRDFLHPETRYLKVVDSDLANQQGQPLPGRYGSIEKLDSSIGKPILQESSSSIIAYVKFKLWSEDRKVPDWNQPFNISEGDLGAIGDVNLKIARSFRGQQKEMSRIHLKGKKCICKSSPFLPSFHQNHPLPPFSFPFSSQKPDMQRLATHPSHQHRGAATLLLEHVKDLARREGLDILLQGTPAGYPLYHKLGFEDVAAFEVDLGDLAGEGASGESYRTVLMKLGVGSESR